MSVAGVDGSTERTRAWGWLIGPSDCITGEENRSGARLLAALTLAHLLATILGAVVGTAVRWRFLDSVLLWGPLGWILGAGAVLVLVSYLLLRLGHYRTATATYITTTACFPLLAPFVGKSMYEVGLLATALIPMVLTATLLAHRWLIVVAVAVVSCAALELTLVSWPRNEVVLGFTILIVVVGSSILMGVMRRHQSNIEALHMDQLRQSEAALRASHERVNALLSASRDLVVVMDAQGRRQAVFGGFEEITGYDRNARGPRSHLESLHPEDRPRMEKEMASLLERPGGVLRTEWRSLHKDGSYRWLEALATNLLGRAGIDGIVANVRDVTDRKTAEEALARNEQRYRTLFATVTDGVFLLARDGHIVEVNDAACRMLGYTREELTRLRLADIAPPDKREHVEEINREVEARKHLIFTAWHRRKDGTVYPVEVAASVTQLDGEPVFMGVARDITDRIRAEEERRRLQDQLQHAAKMESIGRLAGGVAHDFNNLLTAILGNTHLALTRLQGGGDPREPLSEIRGAALSAAGVTRQLLAFSRKHVVETRPIDVNDLIRHMIRMIERLIGEEVRLRVLPGPGALTVRVDPGLIEQAMVNLVVNARDAMPSGGEVSIATSEIFLDRTHSEARPACPPGRYVVVAISDTGAGMSEEVKQHIFEPFFTTKPRGEGTGLGLATSYAAVEQSGGGIEVISQLGKGSIFKIYLPAVETPALAAAEEMEDERLPLPRGDETILVVEDDPHVRDIVVHSLRSCGYQVLSAASGEEALTLGVESKARIDILVTDVVMPGVNGRELAQMLLKIHPETRTLFTSGYSDNLVPHEVAAEQGIGFLSKPYTIKEMCERVRAILDR